MGSELGLLGESLIAVRALVRFFAGVDPLVHGENCLLCEFLAAV